MLSWLTRRLVPVIVFCFTVTHARASTLNVPGDFATIQACIDAAVGGVDECVVAPGTYVEAINFNGKAITLRSSGGAAVTTINGNGAFHVVQCISGEGPDTILEGFTITGGAATSTPISFPDNVGGGMLNLSSEPTVTNCTFTGNSARNRGGGMYNNGSSPTVTDCTFSGNTAKSGGGMYNGEVSHPIVTDCTFMGNSATVNQGGGMHNDGSNPTVTNCAFKGNTAWSGGGMYNRSSSPVVTGCAFIRNSTVFGGGIDSFVSALTVLNCTFIGNSADFGGGLSHFGSVDPTLINSVFSGNTANRLGGGLFNDGGEPAVTNCTFSGNAAGDGGGGMANFGGACPMRIPTLTNCIFWGDSPDEVFNSGPCDTPTVSYSDVQGGLSGGTIDGGGNIDADPLFVDADGIDNTFGTNDDNLRLRSTSPSIDAGDNTATGLVGISTDLDGNARFNDVSGVPDTGNGTAPIVDMGAYEAPCGNGVVDAGEECDDGGESMTCDTDCTLAECGDGTLNITAGEECDDGNPGSGGGCDATCHLVPKPIPTVSAWGLIVMALLLLIGAKIHFRPRRPDRT